MGITHVPFRPAMMGLLVLAAGLAPAGRPWASPVVDDERLAREFVAGLGRIVDAADGDEAGTLGGEAAAAQLARAAGRRLAIPATSTPCRLGPDRPLYEAVMPAVVVVGSIYKCGSCNDWHLGGLATGWLASETGLVVTNHHVFSREPGHSFGVMTADGKVYGVVEVLAGDEAGDAAVVQIAAGDRKLPWLPLGRPPECGAEVTIVSHPAGRFYCLTEGVVSRYHRTRTTPPAARGESAGSDAREDRPPAVGDPAPVWMSVTADYAVGSSGGPVFNAVGEVVGMVSRTSSSRPGQSRRPAGTPGDQMVFKDCVSLDTLRGLLHDGHE